MTLDSILKEIDPLICSTLDRVLDNKSISEKQAVELFDSTGTDMNVVVLVANELRKRTVGNNVTYVINRNIIFTNVCIKRCGFCAFSRARVSRFVLIGGLAIHKVGNNRKIIVIHDTILYMKISIHFKFVVLIMKYI